MPTTAASVWCDYSWRVDVNVTGVKQGPAVDDKSSVFGWFFGVKGKEYRTVRTPHVKSVGGVLISLLTVRLKPAHKPAPRGASRQTAKFKTVT